MKTLVKITFLMCIIISSQFNSAAQELDTIPSVDSYEVYQNLQSAGFSPELDNVNTTPETYYVAGGMIVAGIIFQAVGHVRKAKAGKILQNIGVSESGIGIKIPIK